MATILYLLTGPTAVGKSALALAWARQHDAEILSCDALQVYRGMNLGTAKPTAEEQAQVPHHGLNLCDPAAAYSVAAYCDYAAETVAQIHARGRRVLVVGGSGFYLKSFFAPVADDVVIPPEVEEAVRALEKSGGVVALVARLREASPAGTGAIDLKNHRRVARALARCLASGHSVPELAAAFAGRGTPFDHFDKHLVRLERSPPDLLERIRVRTRKMLDAGLVDEVRAVAGALRANPAAGTAIGYRETLAWLDAGAQAPLAELEAAIILHTQQLVKKQLAWLRHQVPPHRVVNLSAESPPDEGSLLD